MLSWVSGPECYSFSFFVLPFFFSPLKFFWICFRNIFFKSPTLFAWIFTKTANKICDVIVQFGPSTSWMRSSALQITWKETLASIKFTQNLPAGTVLAWGTSPPVQESSQSHQCHCPQQGKEPGRGAELGCAPDLIITSYYCCWAVFWILYILFWKSLVESQPLYI